MIIGNSLGNIIRFMVGFGSGGGLAMGWKKLPTSGFSQLTID
jgi:hypothetical protein